MDWTNEQFSVLIALANEKRSSSQIADHLTLMAGFEVTRNAVIGKAHRTGIKLHGDGRFAPILTEEARAAYREKRRAMAAARRPPAKKKVRIRKPRKPKGALVVAEPWLALVEAAPPFMCSPLSADRFGVAGAYAGLEEHSCRWPSGDPQRKDFIFCCAPVAAGAKLPYCKFHCSIATASARAR